MYYLWPSQWFPQSNAKANGVRLNKLNKDRIFTLRWNPRRVSETIYSTKSDSLSNANAALRSTHDPTNNSNAALRLTQDLRHIATNALGINTRFNDEPGMFWYHLLHARQQPARNPIDAAEKYPRIKRTINKREQYLARFVNLPTSSGQGRESFIDPTTNTICTLHIIQEG